MRLRAILTATLAAAVTVTVPVPASAGGRPADNTAVIRWNTIAARTIFTENANPIPSSGLYFGFVSLAVYDAAVAIEGGYRPYVRQPRADRHASVTAAVATAAHDVLAHYYPASTADLDADLAATLATVPDAGSRAAGQRAGAIAAARLIALRADDGRNAPITYDRTPAPGVWRPTPDAFGPMVTPWLGFVRPLALRSPAQPRLPGPDPIRSAAYRRDLAEVRAYGAATGSLRTPAQTETALFFNANVVLQYQEAMRDQLVRRGWSAVRSARAFAMLSTTMADSLIRCWRAKYDEAYWRPITAIREGTVDPDPAWTPLLATPPYPEYASGHACITGSMTGTVAELFGSRRLDLVISSSVTGTTRHYDSIAALQRDSRNARIWLGFHFRRAMIDGTAIGTYTAGWVQDHYFQPARWRPTGGATTDWSGPA